ncbi:hypothetical protein RUA4292_03184 [Ruegeria atlantica]|uniref:Uncharacterized protein n=1 Tax=Ruegeria atlantica TaxID=81569 RepID=A0A0P1EFS8_9RHOB|nr:hypothetical protein RUA4292_03184 [Ruegeria atlantica]
MDPIQKFIFKGLPQLTKTRVSLPSRVLFESAHEREVFTQLPKVLAFA